MKYQNLAFLAAFAALALSGFAADTKDQMITKIFGTDQPTSAPPYALAAHALVGKGNQIAVNAWSGGLVFEGATFDRWKTTFAITDPTAARTITFPNSSGTVLLTAIDDWVFEGVTADAYETTVSATDPTADGTIWLPDTGVGVADANLSFVVSTINSGLNAPGLATSVWTGVSAVYFEGATADAYEAALDSADVTADVIYRLADAAAGTYGFLSSTLATNAPNIANSVTGASNGLVFEGATADAYEITISPVDPTADATFSLPNLAVNGAFVMSTLTTNNIDAANSIWLASNALVLEGATADAYETTIAPTDPTADRTITLPDASGTVRVAQASTAVSLTADDQAVTPGSANVIQLSSDNATDTNRTFTLSATGAITGAIYIIVGPATNGCELADTGIQKLSATWSPTTSDTLTLLFDGTNFIELARSNN